MTKPPSPRPLSIKVIAVACIVTGLVRLLLTPFFPATSHWIAPFGVMISGWPAFTLLLALKILILTIGIGLWRLYEVARRAAIGLLCFNLMSVLYFYVNASSRQTVIEHLSEMGLNASSATTYLHIGGITRLVLLGLLLWFLIKRKSAFVKPPTV